MDKYSLTMGKGTRYAGAKCAPALGLMTRGYQRTIEIKMGVVKEVNKEIKTGLILIAIMSSLYMFLRYCQPSNECSDEIYFNKVDINGVLRAKYFDSKQHNYQTIEVGKLKAHVMYDEKSKFYDYIVLGDSLYKPQGSLELKVIRGYMDTTFIIDFGCDK